MRALLLLFLALPLAPTLAGCTGPAPSFEITSVALAERTDDGFVLDFEVQGLNQGDDPLPLRTVDYTVRLEGGPRFTATRSPEATLPRRGDQSFVLPAAFRWGELDPRAAEPNDPPPLPEELRYALRARVTYQATNRLAKLLFDAGVRRPSASFAESGRLLFDDESYEAESGPATDAPPEQDDQVEQP